MDIFHPTVVAKIVNRLEPAKPFLLNSFFPNVQTKPLRKSGSTWSTTARA